MLGQYTGVETMIDDRERKADDAALSRRLRDLHPVWRPHEISQQLSVGTSLRRNRRVSPSRVARLRSGQTELGRQRKS